jgi:hypothetical protein
MDAIDRWTPPQDESTVGNLVQTRTVSIGQLIPTHRFFESRGLLSEQTFPSAEMRAFEQRVFENTFHTT